MLSFWSSLSPVAAPFAVAFAVSLALVPICRSLAQRLGYVAHPREDRWHRRPIALFGGVAIGLTLFVSVAAFGNFRELRVLLTCAALIFVVGLADDVKSLRPSTKLVVEIALASVFLFFGYRLHWTDRLTLDTMMTLVWVVGLTNAFNLLDNMDGLCAGIALIVGVAFVANLLPAEAGSAVFYQAQYLAIAMGATAGFLVYNFHPASIFMGDSGSLLLGLSFAALTLSQPEQTSANSNPLSIIAVPLLVLLIPIFDTILVTVSRVLSGRSPSEGGRDHSSHRLVAIGLSERGAVTVLWLLAAAGGLIGVAIDYVPQSWSAPVASLFVLGMVMFAAYLLRIRVYAQADTLKPGAVTPLVADFMYKRRVVEVLLDLCLVTIAYYGAYRLRYEGLEFRSNFSYFYQSLPIVLAVQMMVLFGVGIYRGVWRYFGLMDTVVVGKGVLIGTLVSELVILYLYRFASYSRTIFAIYAILLAVLLTGSRGSFRLIGEFLARNRRAATRLVVYGAGDGGSLVVRELLTGQGGAQAGYKMLGFVDDDPRKLRMRVQGFPVLGGYDALASLVTGGAVDAVVISTRMVEPSRLREIETLCAAHGVALSRLNVGLEALVPVGSGRLEADRDVPGIQNKVS